jgi:hypothetical protein
VSGQLQVPALPLGKEISVPTWRRLGGSQNWSGQCGEEKILEYTRAQTPTPLVIQPVASCYTSCVIPALEYLHIFSISSLLQPNLQWSNSYSKLFWTNRLGGRKKINFCTINIKSIKSHTWESSQITSNPGLLILWLKAAKLNLGRSYQGFVCFPFMYFYNLYPFKSITLCEKGVLEYHNYFMSIVVHFRLLSALQKSTFSTLTRPHSHCFRSEKDWKQMAQKSINFLTWQECILALLSPCTYSKWLLCNGLVLKSRSDSSSQTMVQTCYMTQCWHGSTGKPGLHRSSLEEHQWRS